MTELAMRQDIKEVIDLLNEIFDAEETLDRLRRNVCVLYALACRDLADIVADSDAVLLAKEKDLDVIHTLEEVQSRLAEHTSEYRMRRRRH